MNNEEARKQDGDVTVPPRIMSPLLTDEQKELIDRYCRKYDHKKSHGRGLLLAALREIRREFGLPQEEEASDRVAA